VHVAVTRATTRRVIGRLINYHDYGSRLQTKLTLGLQLDIEVDLINEMAPVSAQARNPPSDDELDDILNGIAEGRNVTGTEDAQIRSSFAPKAPGTGGDGLGIDEEIIITKKRIPIPKLDDNRLLSDPGIPRLRKISKERLRFKGKGHEVSKSCQRPRICLLTPSQYGDIARMLNMYQLWLDDLYPRAKFADALAIIEKVGHTKRMQIMRKDWIDEGKPRRTVTRDEEDADDIMPDRLSAELARGTMESVEQRIETREENPSRKEQAQAQEQISSDAAGADPDDDELDALLAESAHHETSAPKTLPVRTAETEHDPFADEMEAMADMEDMW
jgi:replication fork protection complex subunit Csm3/Swi3